MAKVDQLLHKALIGKLDSTEKSYLAKLAENPGNENLFIILSALGEAQALEYKPLMEKNLTRTEDNAIPALALQILCLHWNLTINYLDVVKKFIRGMDWDYDGHVKLNAIQVARGFFGNDNMDVELVELLLDVFEDPFEGNAIREDAYDALATMAGKTRDELPNVWEDMDFDHDADEAILNLARNIVQGKTN